MGSGNSRGKGMAMSKNFYNRSRNAKHNFYSRKSSYHPFSFGKKGIFFTFAAIALSLVIISSFKVYTDYGLKDEMQSIEARIKSMDNFVKGMENDIENAIFIAGFRSLLSLEDYMMKNRVFLNNPSFGSPSLNNGFEEVFKHGTITTGAVAESIGMMKNNTFLNWTKSMIIQANKTGIELGFTINDVSISQSGPWAVEVSVDLKIDVKDKKNTASWVISKKYAKTMNITGFVDPVYLVKNNGLVNNTIKKTAVSNFGSEANLNTHLINSYYIEHSDAPSYLMRFENNSASSSNGIESLVNSQKLIDAGLPTSARSAVDYIYYGSQVLTHCRVEEPEYSWFYLDTSHLSFYNAECD